MTKRGAMEGSIGKRPNGTWYARYTVHLPDGTAARRAIYGKTRREVSEELARKLNDANLGLVAMDDKQPIEQYITHWLTTSVKPTVRERSYVTYEGLSRLYIIPILGKVPLSMLTPQQVQGFMAKMSKSRSPRSVFAAYTLLKRALDQAVRWGLIVRNVATLVDPPRQPHVEMQVLTKAQARQFLQHVEHDRLSAYYTVSMSLGLRRGEALGLRWENIDLERGIIYVKHSLQRVNGALHLFETKTDQSNRIIYLPLTILQSLFAHRERQDAERRKVGQKWEEHGYLFTTRHGKPLSPDNVALLFKKHLRNAGLPNIRVHDMRHTAASLMLAQNVPIKVVSDILGHSSIRVTLDIYGHIYEEGRQDAANKIDEIWRTDDLTGTDG